VKIGKAISIELRDGQRLSLSLKETRELYRKLGKMLADAVEGERKKTNKANPTRKEKSRIARKGSRAVSTKSSSSSSGKIISLSDVKRQEILSHLNREISATPRTLTNLLKGVSYSASQLPAIRSIIESQQGVRAKTKGKRTLYLKKKMLAATAKTKRAKVKTAPADTEAKSVVVEAPAASSSTATSA
jgi:hypothetical protein